MNSKQVFDMSDGWLLSTLIISGKKSTLKDIILIGNTINHAIFALDEINNGLSRLEAEGYILFKGKKVYVHEKAQRFDKENKKRFEGCIDMQVRYSEILNAIPIQNTVSYKQYYTDEEYQSVVGKYQPY